uniref:Piwi-like protein 2 n=1 Tax=Isodiametra pulchra TaxID=504439 RepID=B9ZU54_ISOPU|nr:piwi-like protein 2 [Isodiametra pulchra]
MGSAAAASQPSPAPSEPLLSSSGAQSAGGRGRGRGPSSGSVALSATSQHILELRTESSSSAARPKSATPSPPSGASPVNERGGGDVSSSSRVAAGSRSGRTGAVSTAQIESLTSDLASQCLEPAEKRGSYGRHISLHTNHLVLEKIGNRDDATYFTMYHVDFSPPTDNLNFRHRLLGSHRATIGKFSFDGSVLFTPNPLPCQNGVLRLKANLADDRPFDISLKHVRDLGPTDPDTTRIYGTVFQKIMRLLKFENERKSGKSFDTESKVSVSQHNVEIWPGYITSVSPSDGGLRLLCDVSHKVIRTESVLQFMATARRSARDEEHFKKIVAEEIVGTSVLTPYNKKTYKIDDIDWQTSPEGCTFETRDGPVNLVQYYKQHYDISIVDRSQPLLVHIDKKRRNPEIEPTNIYLVPELCQLTGLSDKMREDFRVMKDVGAHTRVAPRDRLTRMSQFISRVNSSPEASEELRAWGLKLANQPLELPARNILNAREDCVFMGPQGSKRVLITDKCDFSNQLTANKCIKNEPLTRWLVIYSGRDQRGFQQLIDAFGRFVPDLLHGTVERPKDVRLDGDRAEDYIRAIKDHVTTTTNIQIVVCLLPTKVEQKYNAIKRQCCISTPVASQVIISRTLSNDSKRKRIVQNIGLQMVAKMGGELWGVQLPTVQQVGRLMVVGIDVYHEAKKRSESWLGVCCSLNQHATRYKSSVHKQTPGVELGGFYNVLFQKSLYKYREMNDGELPERILIYRDGVGDGQMRLVRETEIPQLISACRAIQPDYCPAFTVVICQKRINQRFFDMRGGDKGNPMPGTIVDTDVTRRGFQDFYLVSQHVRQGTVTPTHYVVLRNDPGKRPLDVDCIQKCTFRLTYMYYNWPGSVRVPAPCQYAHKLAQLAGLNISGTPSELLSDRLYFI